MFFLPLEEGTNGRKCKICALACFSAWLTEMNLPLYSGSQESLVKRQVLYETKERTDKIQYTNVLNVKN